MNGLVQAVPNQRRGPPPAAVIETEERAVRETNHAETPSNTIAMSVGPNGRALGLASSNILMAAGETRFDGSASPGSSVRACRKYFRAAASFSTRLVADSKDRYA